MYEKISNVNEKNNMEGEFGNEMRFKETAISNRNFRNEKCNELNRKHSGKNDQ